MTWRIGARHDTEDFPGLITTLAGDTERTETTSSEFSDLVLVCLVDFWWDWVVFLDSLQDEKWSALNTDDTFALWGFDNGLDLLGDGVEWVKVNY